MQEYKQRFEQLCYQTELPKTVWGDEFYEGLSLPIKDKLAALTHLNRHDCNNMALHAIKFDESYHARQREKVGEKILRDYCKALSAKDDSHHIYNNLQQSTLSSSLPPTSNIDANGKLTLLKNT